MTSSHEMKVTCPWCRTSHELASNIPGETEAPVEGDVSLCFACGEWMSYHGAQFIKPTSDELINIGYNPDARRVRTAWVRYHRRGKKL